MRIVVVAAAIFFYNFFETSFANQADSQKIVTAIDTTKKYYMQDNYFNPGDIEVDPQNVINEYHAKRGVGVRTVNGATLKRICLPVFDAYTSNTSVGYCSFEFEKKSYKVPILFDQGDKQYTINHPSEIRVYGQKPEAAAPAAANLASTPAATAPPAATPKIAAPTAPAPVVPTPSRPGVVQGPVPDRPARSAATGLDSYIYSQLRCDADKTRYTDFVNNYGADLTVSAATFKIPKNYLSCLIFKESKFEVMARSGRGARGLGQILRIASSEGMRFYVEGMRISDSEFADIQSQIRRLREKMKSSSNPRIEKTQLESLILKEGFYKASRMWKDYVAHLAKTKRIKKVYTTRPNYVINKYPNAKLSSEDIRNLNLLSEVDDPHVAVGIAGMYLKTIHSKYDIENDDTQVTPENYKKFIVDAGAYNAGDRVLDGAQTSCAAKLGKELAEEPKYVDCLHTYFKSNNSQTSSYTQSIENCLRSDFGGVNSGYARDIKGTTITSDQLSLNQTETECFVYGGQLATHPFSDMMSCNDITKIKGLYGPQADKNNSCRDPLPGAASKDLIYIDTLFKNKGLPRPGADKSIIHRIGTDKVCVQRNAKKEINAVKCYVSGCPDGFQMMNGFYATLSAPDRYFQCGQRTRPGRGGNGRKEGKG